MTPTPQQLKTTFLRQRQSLPLHILEQMSIRRIIAWREYWQAQGADVYVSLGGKDSHTLLHLVRSVYPDVPAVFVDTGLEYPEVRELNLRTPNTIVLHPSIPFTTVIYRYGWPVVSKKIAQYISEIQIPTPRNENTRRLRLTGYRQDGTHSPISMISAKWRYLVDAPFKVSHKCCKIMKVNPARRFQRLNNLFPLIGTTSDESSSREHNYLRYGCNAYDNKNPVSTPLIFWTEQHILQYIKKNSIEVAGCYGDLVEDSPGHLKFTCLSRTGCMFCAFGAHLEPQPNRFQKMEVSHPDLYTYCMDKLGLRRVLIHCGIPYRNAAPLLKPVQADLFEVAV